MHFYDSVCLNKREKCFFWQFATPTPTRSTFSRLFPPGSSLSPLFWLSLLWGFRKNFVHWDQKFMGREVINSCPRGLCRTVFHSDLFCLCWQMQMITQLNKSTMWALALFDVDSTFWAESSGFWRELRTTVLICQIKNSVFILKCRFKFTNRISPPFPNPLCLSKLADSPELNDQKATLFWAHTLKFSRGNPGWFPIIFFSSVYFHRGSLTLFSCPFSEKTFWLCWNWNLRLTGPVTFVQCAFPMPSRKATLRGNQISRTKDGVM